MRPDGSGSLTRLQRHLYAAGLFGCNFLGMVITSWCLKFYFPNEPGKLNLVPAGLGGLLMLLGRLSDGITDPFEGWLSDRSRTRWGRRKPFMSGGLPALLVLFVLLWTPPEPVPSVANFWWGAVVLAVFFVGFSFYIGPYLALLAEITGDSQERVRLSGLQAIYGMAGLIAGSLVAGEALRHQATFQQMSWLAAAVCLPFLLAPLFGPRDDPSRVAGEATPPFFRSVAITFRNRPFQRYVLTHFLFQTGLLTIVAALPYIVPGLLGRDRSFAGHLTGVALLSGIGFVPLILRLARRHSIPWAYRLSIGWFGATALLLTLLLPAGKSPYGLAVAFGIVLIIGVGIGGANALPYALIGDICAHDWSHTGLHRQGMFYCVQGLILKLAYSFSPWLVDQLNTRVESPALALSLVGPLAAMFCLVALIWFRGFPTAEVQAAVEAARRQTSE